MNRASKLVEIRNYINNLMTVCPTMEEKGVKFAVLGDSDGDACLFNGLLATVKIPMGINAVLSSQAQPGEKRAGMFYRSPRRRATDNAGHPAFFSRDMSLGVLAAYVSARSIVYQVEFHKSADAWLHWINNNRTCSVKKPWPFKGCMIRGPHRFAPDDRSDITPTIWAMMGRVWKHRGWPLHSMMKKFEGSDGDISVIEAQNCELGYGLHLKVVQAYLKMLMGQSKEYSIKVGRIAHERLPENLFYEFVAKRTITEYMIDRYLEMKPDPHKAGGHSWIWEKSEVTPERIAKSCGWDFVFMGKIILRHAVV
jgi:hypothetical protein